MKFIISIYRKVLKFLFKCFGNNKKPKSVLYLMQTKYDCETIAISITTNTPYDISDKAICRINIGWLQNPIYGNPWNVESALNDLDYEIIPIKDINNIEPNDKVIALLYCPNFFRQHWISFDGNYWYTGYSKFNMASLQYYMKDKSFNLIWKVISKK